MKSNELGEAFLDVGKTIRSLDLDFNETITQVFFPIIKDKKETLTTIRKLLAYGWKQTDSGSAGKLCFSKRFRSENLVGSLNVHIYIPSHFLESKQVPVLAVPTKTIFPELEALENEGLKAPDSLSEPV